MQTPLSRPLSRRQSSTGEGLAGMTPSVERADPFASAAPTFQLHRDTLADALDETAALTQSLMAYAQHPASWDMQNPELHAGHAHLRRTASDVGPSRPQMHSRSRTSVDAAIDPPQPCMSILATSLKESSSGSSTAPSDFHTIFARLLAKRLAAALAHLAALKTRILDPSSRILVTGDLNAGKSTFTNALLRRPLLPIDQQPLTSVFCEIVDCQPGQPEQAHAIPKLAAYSPHNPATYARFDIDQLDKLVDQEEHYEMVKIYIVPSSASAARDSLTHMSLIDAPGLNRDTVSTTSVFARQAEIDVIVFLVSAENHFTLSGKEFLQNCAFEKQYVFVVVNKWNAIKDKAKARRLISEQIKHLSPATWDNRFELVHFVDASDVIPSSPADGPSVLQPVTVEFAKLEHDLQSFALMKRSASKLSPAQTYLQRLLDDISNLTATNLSLATAELEEAEERWTTKIRPLVDHVARIRNSLESEVGRVEEKHVSQVSKESLATIEKSVAKIARGQLPTFPRLHTNDNFLAPSALPSFDSFWDVFTYAENIKNTFLKALEASVRSAEEEARLTTHQGVKQITNDLKTKFLSHKLFGTAGAGLGTVDIRERVFNPNAMFERARLKRESPQAADVQIEINYSDMVDFDHIWNFFGFLSSSSSSKAADKHHDSELGTLSVAGLGSLGSLGAVTMLGSKIGGARALVEAFGRFADLVTSPTARRWAAPIIAAMSIGMTVHLIRDMPRAIPYNIGLKISRALATPPHSPLLLTTPEDSYAVRHANLIAGETRKVLRLAAYDLSERVREVNHKVQEERKHVLETRDKAKNAKNWFEDCQSRTEKILEKVNGVQLEKEFNKAEDGLEKIAEE